jgi:hypothetical protein
VNPFLTAFAALDSATDVKQMCSLEALGVSAAIARSYPALISRSADNSSRVQMSPIAAHTKIWARSTAKDAQPSLAAMAQRLNTMHATSATGLCGGVCTIS